MKKFFLASILSFTALCATEESVPDEKNIWDERGAYVKYGIGASIPIPVLPTLGFGYYWKADESTAFDLSAMINVGVVINAVNVKLLALFIAKEKFQFGIGPAYFVDIGMIERDGVGLGLLFRKIKPYKKRFFQVEMTQPLFINTHCGLGSESYAPGISITWGNRF